MATNRITYLSGQTTLEEAQTNVTLSDGDYTEILLRAVAVIENARCQVAHKVNESISSTYWEIGRLLHERKIESGHGDSVVKRLAADLKQRFPLMGVSPRQLWNMKKFYLRYSDSDVKLLRAVAVLPWSHNLHLLSKNLDDEATLYYATETLAKGWNRDLLLNAIKMGMHERRLVAPDNNFDKVLPARQAQYANEVFKNRYNLGFLGAEVPMLELELERRLVAKITQFLMELGNGFTFIGNQHILEYGGNEYRVDMLFFHRGLRAMVAIDLKIGAFKPEYAGKMNFYLSLLDRLERRTGENRSIGIILCAEKDHVEVELALEDINKPIGVADYRLIVPKERIQQLLTEEIRAFETDHRHQ